MQCIAFFCVVELTVVVGSLFRSLSGVETLAVDGDDPPLCVCRKRFSEDCGFMVQCEANLAGAYSWPLTRQAGGG